MNWWMKLAKVDTALVGILEVDGEEIDTGSKRGCRQMRANA